MIFHQILICLFVFKRGVCSNKNLTVTSYEKGAGLRRSHPWDACNTFTKDAVMFNMQKEDFLFTCCHFYNVHVLGMYN